MLSIFITCLKAGMHNEDLRTQYNWRSYIIPISKQALSSASFASLGLSPFPPVLLVCALNLAKVSLLAFCALLQIKLLAVPFV